MYLIKIHDDVNDTKGTIIHTPYANGKKLTSGNITLVGDGIDSFEFSINPSNPAWNKIRPLVTLLTIVDVSSDKLIFDGRILKPVQTMTANGQFNIKYTAESKLAYLHDSTQRHGEYNNMTARDFLVEIIAQHNRQVEPHKRFEVGNVTVTTSTDNIYRFLGYEKTFDAIQDKLISRLGGHIRLREGKYIDYLENVGELRNTPIRLRTNLKDMQKEIDPTEIITRLVPLGARLETEEGSSGISEPRLTIESVNNGKDYIDDQALIDEFGIIEGNMTWDDVNTPSTLLLRGNQFFQAQRAARISYDVSVPNMHLIDTTFEEFEVDDYYPIDNPVFAIDEPIQVIGKDIDINNPQMSKLQIGDKHRTLSEYQVQANKQMRLAEELESRVYSLSLLNRQLSSSLVTVNTEIEIIKDELVENLKVPSYYLNHLNQRVNTVNNLQAVDGLNRFSFGFITDMHMEGNAGNSFALMSEVIKRTGVNLFINGGDQADNWVGALKSRTLKQIHDMLNGFAPIRDKMMNVMGNHDDNSISRLWVETMKHGELYSELFRYAGNNSVYGPTGKYHYRDDVFQKVRYIVLDSVDIPYIQIGTDMKYRGIHEYAFRQEQLDWFANVALDTPSSEWGVVVVSHTPPYGVGIVGHDRITRNADLARKILKAYKEKSVFTGSSASGVESEFQATVSVNYTNSGGDAIVWLTGHVHTDNMVQMPEGIPLITTLNDSAQPWGNAPARTLGTISEQAFDVITVDKANRKIYMTRVGAGENREFSY